MYGFFNWLSRLGNSKNSSQDEQDYLYKRIVVWISTLTVVLILLLLIFLTCNTLTAVVTFLAVAGASTAGGAAIGFLFGLPRAEKYRFVKKDDANHNANDYLYSDNTNLEEVSDWLTKIIVGLTLIKFRTIIGWIDTSARTLKDTFAAGCDKVPVFHAYSFGYAVIILYFLVGAGMCYLWARTNLSILLTDAKRRQQELEKKQLVGQLQTLANPQLNTQQGFAVNPNVNVPEEAMTQVPTTAFRNQIESIYNAKTIIDKTDLQKGRWGGKSQANNKILEAEYDAGITLPGLYRVKIKVRSVNTDTPLSGQVAFFLHDTFPSQIVYTVAANNLAEITVTAWEAFVVGGRTEDGTELELDINKVQGFPERFYWKE